MIVVTNRIPVAPGQEAVFEMHEVIQRVDVAR
jgi:hypothetical protein